MKSYRYIYKSPDCEEFGGVEGLDPNGEEELHCYDFYFISPEDSPEKIEGFDPEKDLWLTSMKGVKDIIAMSKHAIPIS